MLYRKCTEGDLSRLYLRVMYGLAEFAGVPVNDKIEGVLAWTCKESKKDFHLHYPVESTSPYPHQPTEPHYPFAELCQGTLERAKNG